MTNRKLNIIVLVAFGVGAWIAWRMKPPVEIEKPSAMDGVFARSLAESKREESEYRASLSHDERADYDLRQAQINKDVDDWLESGQEYEGYFNDGAA